MKLLLLILFPIFLFNKASAQLAITQGAQLAMTGNVQLTLNNASLINNGNFTAGNSIVSFTGKAASSIGGTQAVQFNELEVNKTGNAFVLLLQPIGVAQRLLFTSGFLDLNSFNTDLGTTGILKNETETARLIGPNGGEVLFNVNLNAPLASNPANLGIFITSGQNLGNVTIRRGHKLQENNVGGGKSILRYYEIVPANNTNLNATLAFSYMDAELNNLTENSLLLFENAEASNWTNLGFSTRDVNGNFLEKAGIGSLGRFTLFNSNTNLPVRFVSFNAKCGYNAVTVSWKTAQEQDIRHYSVERSSDGINWTVIGQLSARGNRTAETSYVFTDSNPLQNSFYRVAEYDLDGKVHYSGIIRSSCTTDVFSVFPNPVQDKVFIYIFSGTDSKALIQLYDNKGALVKLQNETLVKGSNLIGLDMKLLVRGIYFLSAAWNHGTIQKRIKVIKQ